MAIRIQRTRPAPFSFPYHSLRNISGPEDQVSDRRILVGQAPVASILDLPTNENVRDYLLEAEGKQRRRPTQVHRAILETLKNAPSNFSVLNGGVVIVAHGVEIDEKEKVAKLERPSIINGSQTQGVIRDFVAELTEKGDQLPVVHIKYEIVVCNDDELIAETSIARNYQNDVAAISIAGRLGQLDELEASLKRSIPDARLRKSETKLSDDYIATEKLLQVIAALTPSELWPKSQEGDNPNKVYTYSMKAKCLKDFQDIYVKAKNSNDPDHQRYKVLYKFYLDIAAEALSLYEKWKQHPGFRGTRIRSIDREGAEIVDVPDGLVFPILASLSAFAKETRSGWQILPPEKFRDEELIRAAKNVYTEIANHDPWTMGKSKACYSALYQITRIYKKLAA